MKRLFALASVLALILVACGGTTDDAASRGGSAGTQDTTTAQDSTTSDDKPQREATITMTDSLTFEPATVIIEAGGTVTWVNDSNMDHTSTANANKAADASNVELPKGAKPWNSGFIKPGDEFAMTFDEPGTYRYFCIPHEKVGMTGTIEVVE